MPVLVCTAIPYVNGDFHLGNAVTEIAGDVHARYLRMRGVPVRLQVGVDENGLKIKEAAEVAGRDPLEFVREMSDRFRETFDALDISYDDFVRTTEPRHAKATQALFARLRDAGHVYLGKYEGWYDVSTETYYRPEDIADGKSPDGNPVRWVSEDNYFFRLSGFADALLAHIGENPEFIRPEARRNEVLSFIRQGLRDISITRRNPGWGIPVPGDEEKVVYVWFDALINYLTTTGWPDEGWEANWPPRAQWVGKDILTRFHATLWPAMLMGIGVPLFETVVAHGWLLFGGEKLSKSKGAAVRPVPLAERLAERAGVSREVAMDVVRHYVTSTISLDSDFTITYEEFDQRYNSDLANDLGNALNRSLAMAHKFVGGIVPGGPIEPDAVAAILQARDGYEVAMADYQIARAVESAWSLVRFLNKYIDTRAPWALAKNGNPALAGVIRSMLVCLRAVEGLIRPALPTIADHMAEQLGVSPLEEWSGIEDPNSLPEGTALGSPRPIFPRLDLKRETSDTTVTPVSTVGQKSAMTTNSNVADKPGVAEIEIADFAKVELRVARVFEAEPLEGSDRLMKLIVLIGEERRQIVAGIRKNYAREDLIGRQIVVCTNLKPAKLRGVESQGMVLAAIDDGGGAILLQPEREAPEGARIK